MSALHERILRQEPLIAKRSTLTTHKQSIYDSQSDIAWSAISPSPGCATEPVVSIH